MWKKFQSTEIESFITDLLNFGYSEVIFQLTTYPWDRNSEQLKYLANTDVVKLNILMLNFSFTLLELFLEEMV